MSCKKIVFTGRVGQNGCLVLLTKIDIIVVKVPGHSKLSRRLCRKEGAPKEALKLDRLW